MDTNELEALERSMRKLLHKCMFAHMQDVGMHPGQLQLLCLLFENGAATQTDLARLLGVSNAAVGTSVRRMVKAGLIEKRADKNDLRATSILLTDKGRSFSGEARRRTDEVLSAKYEGLTQEQMEHLGEILLVVKGNVQRYYKKLKG